LPPLGAGDARGVHFAANDPEGLAVQEEVVGAKAEGVGRAGGGLRGRGAGAGLRGRGAVGGLRGRRAGRDPGDGKGYEEFLHVC
jgi:hypothetical protein